MRSKWMISVRTHYTSKQYIFTGKEGEKPAEVYRKVKQVAGQILDKLKGQIVTVEIISRTHAFKPPVDKKAPKNHWWCPYCRKFRIFMWNRKLETKRCPICGITDHDFYVKKYNGIFKEEWNDWAARYMKK